METKTLKQEILEKYFKPFTFDDFKNYFRHVAICNYDSREDFFGFVIKVGDCRKPYCDVLNICNPPITVHVPKGADFTKADCDAWLEEQGFEWIFNNGEYAYRIKS